MAYHCLKILVLCLNILTSQEPYGDAIPWVPGITAPEIEAFMQALLEPRWMLLERLVQLKSQTAADNPDESKRDI